MACSSFIHLSMVRFVGYYLVLAGTPGKHMVFEVNCSSLKSAKTVAARVLLAFLSPSLLPGWASAPSDRLGGRSKSLPFLPFSQEHGTATLVLARSWV
jgi:hypothetical protein